MENEKVNTKDEFTDKVMFGLDKVYKKLIEFKKQKNTELVIMEGNKIVKVKPK